MDYLENKPLGYNGAIAMLWFATLQNNLTAYMKHHWGSG